MKTQKLDICERTQMHVFPDIDLAYQYVRVSKIKDLIFDILMTEQEEGGNTKLSIIAKLFCS